MLNGYPIVNDMGMRPMAGGSAGVPGLEPEDVRVVSDVETLRLLAHPLRLRIIEALRTEPLTVKGLAAVLETSQTKLYYHVNLLAERGLIRVVETRQVSGITEKRYRVAAYRLTVGRDVLHGGDDGGDADGSDALDVFLSVVLDESKSEIRKSARAGLIDLSRGEDLARGGLALGRKWMRLTPAQAHEVWTRTMGLAEELAEAFAHEGGKAESGDAEPRLYEMLAGLNPILPPAGAEPGTGGERGTVPLAASPSIPPAAEPPVPPGDEPLGDVPPGDDLPVVPVADARPGSNRVGRGDTPPDP